MGAGDKIIYQITNVGNKVNKSINTIKVGSSSGGPFAKRGLAIAVGLILLIVILAFLAFSWLTPQPLDLTGLDETTRKEVEKARSANTTPSRFVRGPAGREELVFIFVHGIFGDAIGTWTNAKRGAFWDQMTADAVLRHGDAFVFGFPSDFFNSAASFSIGEASSRLDNVIVTNELAKYKEIVFVSHSMGGLVVLTYLLDHPEIAGRTPMVYLYSTPQEGSRLADLAVHVIANPGLRQMMIGRGRSENQVIEDLQRRWALKREGGKWPAVYCAYETKPIGPFVIVDRQSATRFCGGTLTPIARDHIGVVKPEGAGDDAVVALSAAVRKVVRSIRVELRIRAFIDGRSRFVLQGGEARWHHLSWAAPGLHGGKEPTFVNGIRWYPAWPKKNGRETRVRLLV